MKLFQKLLLAPAALGLMAPVAASAADLNIAVTPAIFWLSRPQGELTGQGNTFNSFGYLLQTTFRF